MNGLNNSRINELLRSMREGNAAQEDYLLLLDYIDADESGEILAMVDHFLETEPAIDASPAASFNQEHWAAAFREIKPRLQQPAQPMPAQRRVLAGRRWWMAAAVLLLTGMSIYLLLHRAVPVVPELAEQRTVVIEPGKEGAVLTLADGRQIVLDSIKNGQVASQDGTVLSLNSGFLSYEMQSRQTGPVLYNTVTTSKGRQFRLTLPDGSNVWLNAGSALRFPTRFEGHERRVEVSGEAYFEIAAQPSQPFLVNIAEGKAEVQVLGTDFNVNAYTNEAAIAATLLSGKIRVMNSQAPGKPSLVLTPGQQARTGGVTAEVKLASQVNLDKVMAWKNGLFNFEDASLEEIMRQLERWYDIEVVYEKGIPDVAVSGKITRGVSLEKLLEALRKMGLHYRLEERRLVVLP